MHENIKNPLESTHVGEISLPELLSTFRSVWKYLISKWIIIVFCGFVGLTCGFFYSRAQAVLYTAQLTFVLEEEQSSSSMGGYASIAGQFGIDLGGGGGGAFSTENLITLMKSRTIITNTLLKVISSEGKKITLAEYFIQMKGLREQWNESNSSLKNVSFPPGISADEFTLNHNRVMTDIYKAMLKSHLTVGDEGDESNFTIITVKSSDEIFAKNFTDALAEEVSNFYVETKTKKSTENLSILQHQTDSVKRALNNAISGVAISTDATPNLNPSRQVLRIPSQRRQFDVQANQAILTQLIQNLEIAKVSLRKETPLIQIIDRPILPLPKEESSSIIGAIIGFIIGVLLISSYFIILRLFSQLQVQN